MAPKKKKNNQAGFVPVLPRYKEVTESALWKRIGEDPDLEVRSLADTVAKAAQAAAHLLDDVAKHMPLYTLHNERHILNVVGWMERLLGREEGIAQLSPLECALAMLAAYTHDLGMSLTRAEYDDHLDENSSSEDRIEYSNYRGGFQEEVGQIAELHGKGLHGRAGQIEAHILTDFLRKTHSDKRAVRMKRRLTEIELETGVFSYRGVPFRDALELIAISHNHPAFWLRKEAEHHLSAVRTTVGDGEPVNYVFMSLLLRLADIMDFDASRTPTILFRHVGLDGALASHFDKLSEQEWRKHLAITGLEWPADGPLVYRADACPHPVIEKAVHDFIGWIREEVAAVRAERDQICHHALDDARLRLVLPDEVKAEVRPAKSGGLDAYEYHPWSFHLDQQEIIQLLMGEKLYGNPSLCIRELLQNALDALELRDLRMQLVQNTSMRSHRRSCGESHSMNG